MRCLPVLALLFLPFLAACGFQPVYAIPDNAGLGAAGRDAITCQLEIAPITGGRPAQLLEIALAEQACGGLAQPKNAAYRLSVTYGEAIIPIIIESDASIARYAVQLEAVYALQPMDGGQALTGGNLRRRVSYNAHQSDFATTIAERDARQQAVRAMAGEIIARLRAWQAREGA